VRSESIESVSPDVSVSKSLVGGVQGNADYAEGRGIGTEQDWLRREQQE